MEPKRSEIDPSIYDPLWDKNGGGVGEGKAVFEDTWRSMSEEANLDPHTSCHARKFIPCGL